MSKGAVVYLMKLSTNEIITLNQKVSVIKLAEDYGLEWIPKSASQSVMRCPFHDADNTPSLFCDIEKNVWHCFGCNAGGSALDFIIAFEKLEFKEALQKLKRLANYDKSSNALEDAVRKLKEAPVANKDEETINSYAYFVGIHCRDFLNRIKDKEDYDELCVWVDNQYQSLDGLLRDNPTPQGMQKFYNQVVSFIEEYH